jgi:hypothetical protein
VYDFQYVGRQQFHQAFLQAKRAIAKSLPSLGAFAGEEDRALSRESGPLIRELSAAQHQSITTLDGGLTAAPCWALS